MHELLEVLSFRTRQYLALVNLDGVDMDDLARLAKYICINIADANVFDAALSVDCQQDYNDMTGILGELTI